jgi:ABC-type sugar transport system permease subunit
MGNLIANQFLQSRDWAFGSASAMMLIATLVLFVTLWFRASRGARWKQYESEGGSKGFSRDEAEFAMKRKINPPGLKRNRAVGVGFRAYSALTYIFLYLPILVVVVFSFNDSRYV